MTFSIVARDPGTGALGVATATGGPAVGALVPHARAQTGAIATQALTNPLFGFDGLDLLADAKLSASQVLEQLLGKDEGRNRRQCILIDRQGRTAAWTGPACIAHASALEAEAMAVAGNMLTGREVIESMALAFEGATGPLADRLLAALLAGQRAGGDVRGVRSAALKVFFTQPFADVDLRADWSEAPIEDLRTVLAATRDAGYAEFFAQVPRRP